MSRKFPKGPEKGFTSKPWADLTPSDEDEFRFPGSASDDWTPPGKSRHTDSDDTSSDETDDGPLSAKGGKKGKPTTDDGATDVGGKGNGKGKGKDKDTGDTTTDTGSDSGDTTTDTGDTATDTGSDSGDTTTDTGDTTTDTGPYNTSGADGLYDVYVSGMGDLGVDSGFNIELMFSGSWTVSQQTEIIQASEYISTLVTGDIPDYYSVDDIRIGVGMTDIDGSGGILAQAGVSGTRYDGSYMPFQGSFVFDSADIGKYESNGLFDDIALHEMVHLLGFGSKWGSMGLVENNRFTGDNAMDAYAAIYGGSGGVPVETDGGAGTAGAHWDEAAFGNELMTGYINSGNHISGMSVAALEDMGYDTIYDPADPAAAMPQMDDFLLA